MPTSVPVRPTGAVLRRLGVAKPVASAHGLRWSDMLAFLLGHNVQSVYSGYFGDSQASNAFMQIAWNPSPLCKVLYVAIEMLEAAASPPACTIAITIGGGAATLLSGSLYGSPPVYSPRGGRRARQIYDAYLDVSGVTAGTTTDIKVAWTNTTNTVGIQRIHIFEVPLADVDPITNPATEPGVIAGAWPNPPNPLCDSAPGVTSLGYGFPRIYAGLDLARAQWRVHRQYVLPENTSDAISTTSAAFAAFNNANINGGGDPTFRLRARRLYTTSVTEAATLRIRYRTALAGDTCDFRAVINGSNNDFGGGALTGTTTWTAATLAVTIPTSTTDQVVDVTFAGKTSGTLYVSQVALISADT